MTGGRSRLAFALLAAMLGAVTGATIALGHPDPGQHIPGHYSVSLERIELVVERQVTKGFDDTQAAARADRANEKILKELNHYELFVSADTDLVTHVRTRVIDGLYPVNFQNPETRSRLAKAVIKLGRPVLKHSDCVPRETMIERVDGTLFLPGSKNKAAKLLKKYDPGTVIEETAGSPPPAGAGQVRTDINHVLNPGGRFGIELPGGREDLEPVVTDVIGKDSSFPLSLPGDSTKRLIVHYEFEYHYVKGTPPPCAEPPVSEFFYTPDSEPAAPKPGQTVSFDGSGSHDPDGHIVTWKWTFGAALHGGGSPGTVSGGNGPAPSVAFSGPGVYPVTLKVTDDDGLTISVTHNVLISGPGSKGGTTASIPCPDTGAPLGTGFTDIRVPSYAQNVRIQASSTDCPGATLTIGTQGLIPGNTAGDTDEWGQQKDTYHVNWSLSRTGAPVNGHVTVTVEWD